MRVVTLQDIVTHYEQYEQPRSSAAGVLTIVCLHDMYVEVHLDPDRWQILSDVGRDKTQMLLRSEHVSQDVLLPPSQILTLTVFDYCRLGFILGSATRNSLELFTPGAVSAHALKLVRTVVAQAKGVLTA